MSRIRLSVTLLNRQDRVKTSLTIINQLLRVDLHSVRKSVHCRRVQYSRCKRDAHKKNNCQGFTVNELLGVRQEHLCVFYHAERKKKESRKKYLKALHLHVKCGCSGAPSLRQAMTRQITTGINLIRC